MTTQGSAHGRAAGTRIIALLNQKGGVGKTTSAVNIGAALAMAGQRVCMVDLDPQSHLTYHLGIDSEHVTDTVYDLLIDPECTADQVRIKDARPGLDVLLAEVDLAGAENELANQPDRQDVLRKKFEAIADDYDVVLIDCPPSLGLLTLNALTIATEIFVPMQAHFLALQGVGRLLDTVGLVCQSVNPRLRVTGIILCMHEGQTTLAREIVADLDAFFDAARDQDLPWRDCRVLRPPIRRNIKLAEAPSFGNTIFDYAPWCRGAMDYRKLVERLLASWSEAETETEAEETADGPAVTDADADADSDVVAVASASASAAMEIKDADTVPDIVTKPQPDPARATAPIAIPIGEPIGSGAPNRQRPRGTALMSPATPDLPRRHARPWRIAFIFYAVAMTVATHWPDFTLAAEVPATDKSLHFIAFGGLTWMLWRTRWLRSRRTLMMIILIWATFDELSQGLPIFHRTVTWEDLVAGALGAIVVSAWLGATRPIGGELNRLRLSLHQFVFDETFRPPTAWIVLAGAFLACSLPPVLAWSVLSPMGTARLILLAVTAWALASLALFRSMQVQQQATVAEEKRCFGCGRPATDVVFDGKGRAQCPECSAWLRRGQWEEPAQPSTGILLAILIRPTLIALGLAAVVLAPIFIGALIVGMASGSGFLRAGRDLLTLFSDPLIHTIDLAALLLLMAVVINSYRVELARWYDRSVRCRRCRHDIRATPTVHGIGRCGECGTMFLRAFEDEDEVAEDDQADADESPDPTCD